MEKNILIICECFEQADDTFLSATFFISKKNKQWIRKNSQTQTHVLLSGWLVEKQRFDGFRITFTCTWIAIQYIAPQLKIENNKILVLFE
jgi:hypothetical protein